MNDQTHTPPGDRVQEIRELAAKIDRESGYNFQEDAAFLGPLLNHIEWLLAENERLEAENAELRARSEPQSSPSSSQPGSSRDVPREG